MRVLLAIDGSPCSIQARDLVATLPPATQVRVLTAYDSPVDWVGDSLGVQWVAETEEELRTELEAQLDQLTAPLVARHMDVHRRAVRGRPATAIVEQAVDFGADAIVLGSRGHSRLRSMLLGSVSAEVVERAPCSVLIARSDRVSRLLVATNGSATAEVIPAALARWEAFQGLPAEVISVAPPPNHTFELLADAYTLGTYEWFEDREAVHAEHQRFAETIAQRLREAGINATGRAASGDPAHEIIEAARGSAADLIVTGSRGLRGLERLVLGSVARNLAFNARASVLVVRPTAAQLAPSDARLTLASAGADAPAA